jgi:membrane glycosyltransferase
MTKVNLNASPQNIWENISKQTFIQNMTWFKLWHDWKNENVRSHFTSVLKILQVMGKWLSLFIFVWGFNIEEIPYDSPSNEPF